MKKLVVKPRPIRSADIICYCIFCGHKYIEGYWHHDIKAIDVCFGCFSTRGHIRGFGMPQSIYWRFDEPGAWILNSPERLLTLALQHLELAIVLLERQCKLSS